MQTRHILITLLAAAHVFVALAVVSWAQLPGEFADRITFLVVSTGQVGLLSIWMALGRRAAPWRPVALLAVIVAWGWVEASKTGVGLQGLFVFLSASMATVAILATARGFGLRLFLPDVEETKDTGPWQFSLSRLFAWTTSLSICLGLVSLLFRHLFEGANDVYGSEAAFFSTVSTAINLMSLLVAWMRLRYRNFAAVVVFLLLVFLLLLPCQPQFFTFVFTYFGLQFLLLVGSLVVVRVAGYRLEFGGGKGPLARNG